MEHNNSRQDFRRLQPNLRTYRQVWALTGCSGSVGYWISGTYRGNRAIPLTERREVEFDAQALVGAVGASLRAAQAFGLPGLAPTNVRFFPREGQVEFLYGERHPQRAVRMTAEQLGAVLVSYCIRVKIPMPRRAEKGIRIEADVVILAFRTVWNKAPAPEGPDNTPGAPAPVTAYRWIEPEKVVR
jgi:hypothetical protein